jgi:hypothetical protein
LYNLFVPRFKCRKFTSASAAPRTQPKKKAVLDILEHLWGLGTE